MNNSTIIKDETKIPYFKRLRTKMSICFLVISLLMITLLSTGIYNASSYIISKNMAEKASEIAKSALDYIDVKEFQELKTVEDEQKDSYKKMRESLNYIRKISGSKYVYTMRKTEDGKLMYVVDGSEDSNISHIGDIEESSEDYESVLSGNVYKDSSMKKEGKWGVLISSYYPIKDNGKVVGFVGVDYDTANMYAGLQRIKFLSIIFTLVAALIIFIFSFFMTSYIAKPIISIANISRRVSNNNLNVEKLNVKSHDEVGVLSNSFNKMIDNIKQMILAIQETAADLEDTSKTITNSAYEIGNSSDHIASALQEIAIGSTSQAQETDKTYKLTEELSDKLEKISAALNTSAHNTDKMKVNNEIGKNSIKELDENFNEYLNSVLGVSSQVSALFEASTSIRNILESINAISEQTNLLALNAAIEAARAGEHGKGFAVVAEEVRKLAEQAASSTKEIQFIVENIFNSISNVNSVTKASNDLVYKVKSSIGKSQEAFYEVGNTVNTTISEINVLSRHMQDINRVRIDVLNAVEKITATTEQSSAAAEEISASAEEQSSAMEDIIAAMKKLDDMVEVFNDMINKYKV